MSTSASDHASGSQAGMLLHPPMAPITTHRIQTLIRLLLGKIISKIEKLLGLLGDASLTSQSHGLEVAGTGSVSPQLSPRICFAAGENTDE